MCKSANVLMCKSANVQMNTERQLYECAGAVSTFLA